MGKVVISPNIVKTAERIDFNGNVINPRTKQIIQPKEAEYVPPVQVPPVQTTTSTPETTTLPQAPPVSSLPKAEGLSILDEIEATKQRLAQLEELKKLKIAEKKKELELLES